MDKEKIYILVDCDGDTICAFTDEKKAIKEALECGCKVYYITLYK